MKIEYFFIPYHFKDIKTLAMSCDTINELFKPKKIYAIGANIFPSVHKNLEIIKEQDIKEVIPVIDICKLWQKRNKDYRQRGGWLYQQIIKMLAYRICPDMGETYMICDADIIWTKNPYKEAPDNSQPLSKSFIKDCWMPEAVKQYTNFMENKIVIEHSFINHHMIIKKDVITEIINYVEKKYGCRYDQALINNYDFNTPVGFSEYETYANYYISKRKDHFDVPLKVKKLKGIPNAKEVERYVKECYWDFLDCQHYNRK